MGAHSYSCTRSLLPIRRVAARGPVSSVASADTRWGVPPSTRAGPNIRNMCRNTDGTRELREGTTQRQQHGAAHMTSCCWLGDDAFGSCLVLLQKCATVCYCWLLRMCAQLLLLLHPASIHPCMHAACRCHG